MTVISIAAPLPGGLGDMAYYYHVKIYPKQDPTHWEWKSDLHREQLEQRVLVPYREGRPIIIDEKTTRMDDLERITIEETDAPWDTHTVGKNVTDEPPTPYIGEILNAAFSRAHAVVVLFTPDDKACLRQQFRSDSDPRHEVEPTGQARPNVLFEAGMAMRRDSNRTILVELGTLRPFSDIGGRNLLRIDDTSQQRQQLAQRLGTAGCPVKLDGIEWHTAGDFDAALELAQASPQAAYAPMHSRLSREADSLLVEATRDSRDHTQDQDLRRLDD